MTMHNGKQSMVVSHAAMDWNAPPGDPARPAGALPDALWQAFPWHGIQTVLTDMDGPLLDLHFDDHFYRVTVPKAYADACKIDFDAAVDQVMAIYRRFEGTLAWYDVDHLADALAMDLPAMKRQQAHRIGMHAHTAPFLRHVRGRGLPIHLVTNAHDHSLNLKLEMTPLGDLVDSVTISHHLGLPKEDPNFWSRLQERIAFDPATTLLIEDSETILHSARDWGIVHHLHLAAPSSRRKPQFSVDFPSLIHFNSIMPP